MWLIGSDALCGNGFVLIWKFKSYHTSKAQDMLLSNLALSDLLTSVYMLIITLADIYFGENFPMQSESWRSSLTCRIAGAISIISSEASVFFVTLISIDRHICLPFSFSNYKLNKKLTYTMVIITWIISLGLGIIPSSLAGKNFKFYENSPVCKHWPSINFTQKVSYRKRYSCP